MQPTLPAEVVLTGEGAALHRLLDRLAGWEGAAIAGIAAEAGVDCAVAEARAADLDPAVLLASLRCVEAVDPVLRPLSSAALILSIPVREGHALVGLEVGVDGTVEFEAHLPSEILPPLLAGLRKGSGPAVLSTDDALFHARFRTSGIAETVRASGGDPKGQGERLFALSSSILAGSVLDGTVEAAWYAPREGDALPPLAVALGATSRTAVAEGTSRYVTALQERWPIVARPVRLGGGEGQCLDGLRVMPGFAPCWVARDSGVVLAWNEATVLRAVGGSGAAGDRAVVRFDRFPAADAVLQRARGLEERPTVYPWTRLEVRAETADGLRVTGMLVAAPGAAP